AATRGTAPAPHTARTRQLSATAHARRRHRSRRTVAAGALAAVGLLVLGIIALASSGGTGTRTATAHRSGAAAARTSASSATPAPARPRRSTPPAPAKSTTTAASTASTPPPAPTVSGSVEALGSLLAQEAQSGAIDPHAARQLASGLAEVLGAYEAGHALDARRGVQDLSSRLTALQSQGRITQPAAAPLASSLATLEAAVLRSTPASAQAQGNQPAAEAPVPGHDGRGHGAEKHRDQQAAPEGD
ncbi:MAG: hypothetical protein JWL67_1058, partial [Solirubrobacterales bacterium]|nr:hypothetical protein [Solirubrobacterales bacterium]